MERRRIRNWEIGEFIFISVLGTLLHFVYEWTGKQQVVAAFSAVNESTWEHLKLLFYPVLFYTVLQYLFLRKEVPCLWSIKARAVLIGLAFIVVFFYTYSGILGTNYAWLDIGSFYVSALLVSIYSYQMAKKKKTGCHSALWIGVWLVMLGLFIGFTYQPPDLGIFRPPVLMAENYQK
ncbi:MAG: hypothetical protein HFI75_04085 [Lachnospiraceae bacterium]|nr:hypothetical protein [Lachnospiraceae bacterium]